MVADRALLAEPVVFRVGTSRPFYVDAGLCTPGLPCCPNYFPGKRCPSHYRHTHSGRAPRGKLVYYESIYSIQFRLLYNLDPFDVQSILKVLPNALT